MRAILCILALGLALVSLGACGIPQSLDATQQSLRSSCTPTEEVCDGKDNDCDGTVDEVSFPSEPCMAACGGGLIHVECINGEVKKTACVPNLNVPHPKREICDGKDNDCDGTVDEGLRWRCRQITGLQKYRYCVGGTWSACQYPSKPKSPGSTPR